MKQPPACPRVKDQSRDALNAVVRGDGICVFAAGGCCDNRPDGNDHYQELREFLSRLKKPLYSIWILRDVRVAYDDMLPIYTHDFWGKEIWKGKIKYLNEGHNYMHLEEIPVGYALIDREYYNLRYNRIPDYLDSPPKNWQLAFESENKKIALFLTKKK